VRPVFLFSLANSHLLILSPLHQILWLPRKQPTLHNTYSNHFASPDACMATTEPPDAANNIEKTERVNGIKETSDAGKSESASTKAEQEFSPSSATGPTASKDGSPARPDMVAGTTSARSTSVNGQNTTTTLNMPHPKKFSHIDINKRFLEKNSPASSTGHTTSPSLTNKPGSSTRACLHTINLESHAISPVILHRKTGHSERCFSLATCNSEAHG
jgi:hypothetical protein